MDSESITQWLEKLIIEADSELKVRRLGNYLLIDVGDSEETSDAFQIIVSRA